MTTEAESPFYKAGFDAGQEWAQCPTLMMPTNGRHPEFVRGFTDGAAEWMVLEMYTRPDAETQAAS